MGKTAHAGKRRRFSIMIATRLIDEWDYAFFPEPRAVFFAFAGCFGGNEET
jgi:hypothetical protein